MSKDDMLIALDRDLADMFDQSIVRQAPGVRNADLPSFVQLTLLSVNLFADSTTLILSRDKIKDFALRLVSCARRSGTSDATLSIRSGSESVEISLKSRDAAADVTRRLRAIIEALDV
jgi:4-aminobutyrate aminotransferase-like enzyme